MDEKLQKALEFSNYTVTLNNQRRILKEKYNEELILYYNNGKFTVTQAFFTFVSSLVSMNVEQTVIVDDNDTPIKIEDTVSFFENVKHAYVTATNKYLDEFQELRKKRNVQGLVDV